MAKNKNALMTCTELRSKITDYNQDKENWFRKVGGVSKKKKIELIDICDTIDDVKKQKSRTAYISIHHLIYWLLDEDKKAAKKYLKGYDLEDEEESIEIEYMYDAFYKDTTGLMSRVIFVVENYQGEKKTRFAVPKEYDSSSPFALWMCGVADYDSVSDDEDEEDKKDDPWDSALMAQTHRMLDILADEECVKIIQDDLLKNGMTYTADDMWV